MYTPSSQFDTFAANVEVLVATIDYRGICDALVEHAKQLGYVGREFNRGYNTKAINRWCKAEASDGRLQYILAGLGNSSDRGRMFVLLQWDYICSNNVTSQTLIRKIKDNPAVKEGLVKLYARRDTSWGTVEGRQALSMLSATPMPSKVADKAIAEVSQLDNAKVIGNRVTFENASLSLAAIIEKYSKKPASKPEVKPVSKPEVSKPNTRKPRAA